MSEPLTVGRLDVDEAAIRDFCERWKIVELAVFGSVLREDFRPDSDIDVLVTFASDSRHTLLDYPTMQSELEAIFGREVDVVNRQAVVESRNWIRRRNILSTARTLYAA